MCQGLFLLWEGYAGDGQAGVLGNRLDGDVELENFQRMKMRRHRQKVGRVKQQSLKLRKLLIC